MVAGSGVNKGSSITSVAAVLLQNGRTRNMMKRTDSRLSATPDKGEPDRQFVAELGDRHLPPAESAVERVGQDRVVDEAAAA
jgi:hypothetical protein